MLAQVAVQGRQARPNGSVAGAGADPPDWASLKAAPASNRVSSGTTGANRDRKSLHGLSGNARPPRANSLRLPSLTVPFAFP